MDKKQFAALSTFEQPHQLSVNGQQLATGDAGSISMLAGNIAGRNFLRREPWREQTHAQYLAWLGAEWGVALAAGMSVAWGPVDGSPEGEAVILSIAH